VNLKKLEPYLKYVALIAALLAVFLWMRSCARARILTDAYSELKGQNQVLQKENDRVDAKLKAEKKIFDDRINELQGALDSHATVISTMETSLEESGVRIQELREELADVPAGDLAGENAVLRKTVKEQDALILTLSDEVQRLGPPKILQLPNGKENIIYPEGSITWGLHQQFLESRYQINLLMAQIDREKALLQVKDNLIASCEGNLKKARMSGKLKNGLVVAGVVVAGYFALKK